MVYVDVVSGNPEVEMIESCSYSDGTEARETSSKIGKEPIQVDNHCLLTFTEYQGPVSLLETYPYNVYLVLPEGPLITLSTAMIVQQKQKQWISLAMETNYLGIYGYFSRFHYRTSRNHNGYIWILELSYRHK